MKLNYYSETDSLYIEFSNEPSTESVEISQGVVLDYDAKGDITGIDIDNAGQKIQLKDFLLNGLHPNIKTTAA